MLHLSKSHSRVTSFIDDVEDVSRVEFRACYDRNDWRTDGKHRDPPLSNVVGRIVPVTDVGDSFWAFWEEKEKQRGKVKIEISRGRDASGSVELRYREYPWKYIYSSFLKDREK